MSNRKCPCLPIAVVATLFSIFAVSLLASAHAPASPGSDTALIQSARAAIDAANTDWLPAMQAHDAVRVAEPYASGALFITSHGNVITGHAAIERFYANAFAHAKNRIVSGQLVEDGIGSAGKMIYEWGHANLETRNAAGRVVADSGAYLTVWQHQSNGGWKIIRNLTF